MSLGIAQSANFAGLDLNYANLLIQRLAEIRQIFPQLEQLHFIGNSKSMGKTSAPATFWSALGVPIGLTLHPKYFSSKGLKGYEEALKSMVSQKKSPVGCDTLKSVIDHEIGHYLDYGRVKGTSSTGLQLSRDSQILKIYQGMTKEEITENLSSYASKNIREFIAESWSEYQNNPHPRATAKAVGDRIVEIYQSK